MEKTKRYYNKEQLNDMLDDDVKRLIQHKHHFCVKLKNGSYCMNFKEAA